MPRSLPLFPLNTVLVPGAALGLRVFEPRYLDLVRDCGRNGTGFGVCLILEGREVGAPATPAAFGTEARIEDFDSGPDGLLHLRLRGGRRFHVERTRVRDNGLVVADVSWREPDPVAERLRRGKSLQGELPSISRPPPGCVFASRCPLVQPRCHAERPALRALPGGRSAACHFIEE